jgi:two-component system phosphate regulon sensor histidine kinase PhoR
LRIIQNRRNSIVWNSDGDVDVDVEFEFPEVEEGEEFPSEMKTHEIEDLERLIRIGEHEQIIFESNQLDSITKVMEGYQKEREIREFVVKEKMKEFNKNMQQWAFEYSFDEGRLMGHGIQGDIEEILERVFLNNGIDLPFLSQIVKVSDDTTVILQSSNNEKVLLSNQYQTELFPGDFFRKNFYLLVDFPTKSSHIYRSVSLLAFGSMTFTMIILLTFGLTLYYINKQKKISEVKSDFINNMTHEFKTPIATINLAADTMGSPKIIGDADKTNYYLNIIRQENKRMNNQVEKVLQMALIDRQDFQLDFQKTDLHPIIENAVKASDLTAKQKKGKIVTHLRANCSDIPVDEIHFANIVNNLLDNAMKYTENPPEILVETYNQGGKVFIKISDNGVGMSKEVQKHIFDKFYRKPSGNIHNIKGFGLGLSYVKAIVDAHGGTISVNSEPGNGSSFTLSFEC